MKKNYRLKYIKDGEIKSAKYLKRQALSLFTEKLTNGTKNEPKKETFTLEEVRGIVSELMSIFNEYIEERVEE